MSVLAAIGAAAAALATLATSIGASEAINRIEEWRISKRPDIRGLQGIVNAIIDKAASKGNSVLDKIQRKLDGIVAPFGMSSSVQDYIRKARKDTVALRDEATELKKKVDSESVILNGDLSAHEMLSNGAKLSSLGTQLRRDMYPHQERLNNLTSALDTVEKKI